jgi:hypothetical protein
MELWKWQKGRQKQTEYEKFPLWYFRIWKFGFDGYILRYQRGTSLNLHRDPIEGGKHWRLNIKLYGDAMFFQENRGTLKRSRIVLFRPDLHLHSLYTYTKTLKLSFGFVKFD